MTQKKTDLERAINYVSRKIEHKKPVFLFDIVNGTNVGYGTAKTAVATFRELNVLVPGPRENRLVQYVTYELASDLEFKAVRFTA